MRLKLDGSIQREQAKLFVALSSENSSLNLSDSCVNDVGAPTYTHSFIVDGVPLLVTNRVRPWRQGG